MHGCSAIMGKELGIEGEGAWGPSNAEECRGLPRGAEGCRGPGDQRKARHHDKGKVLTSKGERGTQKNTNTYPGKIVSNCHENDGGKVGEKWDLLSCAFF